MKKYITIDGNTAAANSAYMLNDMAIIYPITPSSPMAETIDSYQAKGKKNLFGETVNVTEMQSEAGAAGALHGALTAGSLCTTFTSSQGLLLMIPNMYKIAGELLPCTMHVAARTIATHALSIFGDHSDIMAVRQTGFALVSASSVEEAQDMAFVSTLTSLDASVPTVHFFDGFRTSHEINTIEALTEDQARQLINPKAFENFHKKAFSPAKPTWRGTAQNEDVYFQNRELCSPYYAAYPKIFEDNLKRFYSVTGRKYGLFEYYGAKDAENVIVIMGSGSDTVIQTVNALCKLGEKVGVVKVRLYRPFSVKHFVNCLPATTKVISVLDRTKECGAVYEPLAEDVISALNESNKNIKVLGGRYGISSKEFTCNMVESVFANASKSKPKNHFTVGIVDDVSGSSLASVKTRISLNNCLECKFYGLGSDGTVSANKNTVKILSEEAGIFTQAYFVYDSKKSGGITTSHIRLSKSKITASYLTSNLDFVACHNKSFLTKFDMLENLKVGGIFLLNLNPNDAASELPNSVKKSLAAKKAKLYCIDAEAIAASVGLGARINTIMQTAFFYLSGIIDCNRAIELIKQSAIKSYSKKGEKVLNMNMQAIDQTVANIKEIKVDPAWNNLQSDENKNADNSFFNKIQVPLSKLKGDTLPVSAFTPNGELKTNTSKNEKRNVATMLPCWDSEKCIECNMCAAVCPHAVIRPYLVKSDSALSKKVGAKPAIGVPGYDFKMQISPRDCTGCGNCVNVCPAREKALQMVKANQIFAEEDEKYQALCDQRNPQTAFKKETIKGSQFERPLFEFSGACAGCGEASYIKLLTQLFGDKLQIANATGCSSIYGGSYPSCPYSVNEKGMGPAWANSLFEDNAEFGLGMHKAYKKRRLSLAALLTELAGSKIPSSLKSQINAWLENPDQDANNSIKLLQMLNNINESLPSPLISRIMSLSTALFETSTWIIGGDGWAYDIGFGGLDHVLASNEDVNILVLDTEVYSNTGGQASKSTPMGAIAKFAEAGKRTQKKDLGAIAMTYPNVYVASVALGANIQATINAFVEAKNHKGPSIIIAYSPCINHGTDMSKTPENERNAVMSGYWHTYRYDPDKGLTVDPPAWTQDYQTYIMNQSRYFNLAKVNPELAKALDAEAEKFSKEKYDKLNKNKK